MTCNNTFAPPRPSALFQRVCAFALLVFVAYGAIAVAAHNHGNVALKIRSVDASQTFTDSGDNNSSSRRLPHGGECLVCQLQRNLYSGLLSPIPQIAAPVTQFASVQQTQAVVVSQTFAPRRGRAPPTSLS